jgi:hypothetical protein
MEKVVPSSPHDNVERAKMGPSDFLENGGHSGGEVSASTEYAVHTDQEQCDYNPFTIAIIEREVAQLEIGGWIDQAKGSGGWVRAGQGPGLPAPEHIASVVQHRDTLRIYKYNNHPFCESCCEHICWVPPRCSRLVYTCLSVTTPRCRFHAVLPPVGSQVCAARAPHAPLQRMPCLYHKYTISLQW